LSIRSLYYDSMTASSSSARACFVRSIPALFTNANAQAMIRPCCPQPGFLQSLHSSPFALTGEWPDRAVLARRWQQFGSAPAEWAVSWVNQSWQWRWSSLKRSPTNWRL